MAHAESVYISAVTNRYSSAASVSSSSSLVVFASQTLIAFWDASDPTYSNGVSATLRGHQAEVTCVKISGHGVIFSGDKVGKLQVRVKKSAKWTLAIDHAAHSKSITALATYETLVITGSSDATVKIWKLTLQSEGKGLLDLIQTLDMRGRFPLDIQITSFPGTPCLLLAVASTGRDVNIWSGNETQFMHSVSLSGHQDWVRSLAFTTSRCSPPQLTLASGSQDGTIRLWTIDILFPVHPKTTDKDDFLGTFEPSLEDFAEGDEGRRQLSTKRHVIAMKSADGNVLHLALVFDALLAGHEAGVTSLSWRPGSTTFSQPTLLSTSVDASIIMWSPSVSGTPASSLWINRQRFGDVGGQRFGGFVGGLWAANGHMALTWGWNGGWRRWCCDDAQDGHSEVWKEVGALTGHQDVVKSVAWAPNGEYLLSTGLDQTTRIHGPHCRQRPNTVAEETWHELARPQIHGYDILGAEFLSPLRFISIADEKVARVFIASKKFISTVNGLGTAKTPFCMDQRPAGADAPPLGLSNKAVYDDLQVDYYDDTPSVNTPPFESELASGTLWPETEKVFGHGYELVSIATSHSGSLVVTACKSSSAEHAVLRVYNTRDWKLFGEPLKGHSLTVTRIIFNYDDTLILSVSRDRTWRLFRRNLDDDCFVPLTMDKSHARIIWDCAWTHEPSEVAFATASRDKTVKIWQAKDASFVKWIAVATIKFKEAATAVNFSPVLRDGRRRLAVGLESGEIFIYSSKVNSVHEWTLELTLDSRYSHVDSVNRLLWRPTENLGYTQQLATCSDDRTIRVMTVHLDFH